MLISNNSKIIQITPFLTIIYFIYTYIIASFLNKLLSVRSIENKKKVFILTSIIPSLMLFHFLCRSKFLTYIPFLQITCFNISCKAVLLAMHFLYFYLLIKSLFIFSPILLKIFWRIQKCRFMFFLSILLFIVWFPG